MKKYIFCITLLILISNLTCFATEKNNILSGEKELIEYVSGEISGEASGEISGEVNSNLGLINEENNNPINPLLVIIEVPLLCYMISKVLKYISESGNTFRIKPTESMEYCKELPFDGITPGQAVLLKDSKIFNFGNIFNATLMNLSFKGIIDISCKGTRENINNFNIKIIEHSPTLTAEEVPIYELLNECIEKFKREDESISLAVLQKYLSRSPEKLSMLKSRMEEAIIIYTPMYNIKAGKNRIRKAIEVTIYVIIAILMLIIHNFTLSIFSLHTWILILAIINTINGIRIISVANVLDQVGVNHREKLKGLERYMLKFSSNKEMGVPEIAIWDYYIAFAMAFGISKKVLFQISSCYPNVEDTHFMSSYENCEAINKCKFSISFMLTRKQKENDA